MFFVARISRLNVILCLFSATLFNVCLAGCSDQVILPSANQLIEFENTGPLDPTVDIGHLAKAKTGGFAYRVAPGEVLELTMPAIFQAVSDDETDGIENNIPLICRVSEMGTINLPLVGKIELAGKTLAQTESAVIDAYYPEHAVIRPSVFARVLEYKMAKISISGAVQHPGIYSLRSDEMSLLTLLMKAGGIVDEGADLIRVLRDDAGAMTDNGSITGQRHEEYPQQTAEYFAELVGKETGVLHTRNSSSSKIEVQLTFRQPTTRSTVGILTVTYGERILLTERLDIASEVERTALLERLAQIEPRVSTATVESKLGALAEIFRVNSGRYRIENETAFKNSVSFAEFSTFYPKQKPTTDKIIHQALLEMPHRLQGRQIRERAKSSELERSKDLVVPVRGLNIPSADIVLRDGDSVIVERLQVPLFTVLGLVNAPGSFPCPSNVKYSLMQALGLAGGLSQVAEPRFATVYRLRPDGTINSAIFQVTNTGNESMLTDALNIRIKPGDIVAVEHTPRTRTKVFLDGIFRLNFGAYYRLDEAWSD
jgi:protein involved in polysaccharide export with SLBB domain